MIKTIAHLADIHIRKIPTRNDEYEKVFNKLYESLKERKPDRIVIVGDLVHDYIDLQSEQLIMIYDLLSTLSKIAPVRIIRGNHDCRKRNLKRTDTIKAVIKTLKDFDVLYYDKTGFYLDDNVSWAVWHHGEPKNNPWKLKESKEYLETHKTTTFIDLFHDPVNGCKSATGFDIKNNSFYKISDLKGDISLLGDIHLYQTFGNPPTKAYSGSLIAQNFDEGDDKFHGYLLWDIERKTFEAIPIENEYSFKNILITQFTDFDDLDFEIENPTPQMKIRFIWNTLPEKRTKENERKIIQYITSKYDNNYKLTFSHKNSFIESESVTSLNNLNLENVYQPTIQQQLFKEFLLKIGAEEKMIADVLKLDDEISNKIETDTNFGVEWDIVRFGAVNFMSYSEINIDWSDMNGLFQIMGINTAGKTTIMKLITYILFGKAIETETRMKFGDRRFINNRNGADFCEAYLVLEANGEYYGIRRRTEISKNKSDDIVGVSTTLNYYLLTSPTDELTDELMINKLDEDRRDKTQKKIAEIIGDYDNFMRIVMTTSDTLNRILSNDMAVFIDSLLYDSGLDIFDLKLNAVKEYQKKLDEKGKIVCDVVALEQQNLLLQKEIDECSEKINHAENVILPELKVKINNTRNNIENLTKKLHKINPDILNFVVKDAEIKIDEYRREISNLNNRQSILNQEISLLKESYDEERLNDLLKLKEEYKNNEYQKKLEIKNIEQNIREAEHSIEVINGDIVRLKNDGVKLKNDIKKTKSSRICDKCGQEIKKPEHIEHINKVVAEMEKEMYEIAEKIKEKENVEKKKFLDIIEAEKEKIKINNDILRKISEETEGILSEIGILMNDKNDVEKRKNLVNELTQIPLKIQNYELKINLIEQKIKEYENSLVQIEENKKTNVEIEKEKEKLNQFEIVEYNEKEIVLKLKTLINEKQNKINLNLETIKNFKEQEYRNMIINLYKKCVHRDGIPKQMLSEYIIPQINSIMGTILDISPFKVWLDQTDLKPKLAYNNRPDAVIDCISASGKERTFASVVLKFALNQINKKTKPQLFLLDEVMGKLDENSVEEFVTILHSIKEKIKRVLIIEHRINLEPDYVINVTINDDGISSLEIE